MANVGFQGANAFTILPSAARTTLQTSDTFQVPVGASSLTVIINSTAIVTAPSLTFTINGVDPVSGATWAILTSAAVTTGSTTRVLRVGPGIAVTANLSASDAIPAWFNVTVAVGNANAMTYSVGGQVA